jgi:hypothetical protein
VNIEKQKINNISAVGIIYREADPRWIFIEMKTADYPRRVFASRGLIIGGNWIGDLAKNDRNPKDTLVRELGEEISFAKPVQNFTEFNLLFRERRLDTYVVKASDWKASEEEILVLNSLKRNIAAKYQPFGDYLQHIPEEVFRRGEPDYSKGDYWGLCSVWQAGLSEQEWTSLVMLQRLAGNLSNESITVMTSLDEIVNHHFEIAWGQDRVLRDFFLNKGFRRAGDFPLIPGLLAGYVGQPYYSYAKYLSMYDVERHP